MKSQGNNNEYEQYYNKQKVYENTLAQYYGNTIYVNYRRIQCGGVREQRTRHSILIQSGTLILSKI